MSQAPPPGWYRDPWADGSLRFWDGDAWTGHVRTPPPPMPAVGAEWDETAGRHRAHFGLRAAAFLIDSLVLNVIMFPISMIFMFRFFRTMTDLQPTITPGQPPEFFLPADFWTSYLLLMAISLTIPVIYAALFESSPHGQTIGKWILNIDVRRRDGSGPIGFGTALGRGAMRLVSLMVLYLGMLWMLWDRDHRTWHDRTSDTMVYMTTDPRPPFLTLLRSAFTRH